MHIKYTLPKITAENLEIFAYTNKAILEGEVRAIVLRFHGLNVVRMREDYDELDNMLASHGVLTVFPYYGPWGWMNFESIKYVDRVVECVLEREGLTADSVPIIAEGGSMGGLSSLVYTKYAKRTPDACFANCPVCDLPYHATERPDLPRTVILAFSGYECGLEAAMPLHSPYHLAKNMPDIPYFVMHGTRDGCVNKQAHTDRFVAEMKKYGKNITYYEVDGLGHCDYRDFPEAQIAYEGTIFRACGI